MGILSRATLSNESYGVSNEDVTEAIIAGDLAYADAMELGAEAQLDADAMFALNNSIVAVESIRENNERLIASGNVTSDNVVLSQESIAAVATILDGEVPTISHEDIDNSPMTSLTISNEGVKDFLTKLYASIKLLFKKIGNSIKKIVVKLVVAMNGVEKAAKKLKDSLKEVGDDDTTTKKMSDKDIKTWNKYFSAIAYRPGTALATLPAAAAALRTWYANAATSDGIV